MDIILEKKVGSMKTEVIMKRELFGDQISQKSKSEYFSATDLVRAGNNYRITQKKEVFNLNVWLRNKSVKEFIKTLENKVGKPVKINSKGKNQHTWVHPYLFIDIALAISPDLKIEVYGWLQDYLIKRRNESGDSYKLATGVLYSNSTSPTTFYREVAEYCEQIKTACGVNDWNYATESQLMLRDKIHNNIVALGDYIRHNKTLVEQAINIAQKMIKEK